MKKILAFLLVCLISLSLTVGCKRGTDTTLSNEDTTTTETTTIIETETTISNETTTQELSTEVSTNQTVDDNLNIYVSAEALSTGVGTLENPTTLTNAINQVGLDGTIYVFGGRYYYQNTIVISTENNGTTDQYKTITAYNDEDVILDFSLQSENDTLRGMHLFGNYWHIEGITIYRAGDNGMLLAGNHNIVENCVFSYNRDSGLQISRSSSSLATIDLWPSNNLIKNCTSYMNADSDGEDADGFAPKLTCGEGNVFDGCIAYCNSDDGWDLYTKTETGPIGSVTLINCVAFNNGYQLNGTHHAGSGDQNGFKLGGSKISVAHTITNCVAFGNGNHGFTDNSNYGPLTFTNCTTYNNSMVDGNKSNLDTNRDGLGNNIYKNILAVQKGTSSPLASSDKFNGTGAYSIWYNNGYYQVTSNATVNQNSSRGTLLGALSSYLDTSFFVSTTMPTPNDTIHKTLRNPDSSVNLGDFLKVSDTSIAYTAGENGSVLGAILSLSAEELSQLKIANCISLINNIGTVTFTTDCQNKINSALASYNELTSTEQESITNYATLTEAVSQYSNLKVANCINLINAIGIVTLESIDAITLADSAYYALSNEEKLLIANYQTLVDAKNAYGNLAIDECISLINNIGTVTIESDDLINVARLAYDNLTTSQQALITNINILISAEEQYAYLIEPYDCIDLINAIGTVTSISLPAIILAEEAYDALDETQKNVVGASNYQILLDARSEYETIFASMKVFLPSSLATYTTDTTTALTTPDGFFEVGPSIRIIDCSVEYNDTTYTKYLDTTSGGSTTEEYIKFSVTGPATVIVVGNINSEGRSLALADASGVRIQTELFYVAMGTYTYNISEAGTYYLYSTGSGIKIMEVRVS